MSHHSFIHHDTLGKLLGKRNEFDDINDDFPLRAKKRRYEHELTLPRTSPRHDSPLPSAISYVESQSPSSRLARIPRTELSPYMLPTEKGLGVLEQANKHPADHFYSQPSAPRTTKPMDRDVTKTDHVAGNPRLAPGNPSDRLLNWTEVKRGRPSPTSGQPTSSAPRMVMGGNERTSSWSSEETVAKSSSGRPSILPSTSRSSDTSSSTTTNVRSKRSHNTQKKRTKGAGTPSNMNRHATDGSSGVSTLLPPIANGARNPARPSHNLQDYQMQLMLLEQQNKKRLLMARQEQDNQNFMISERNAHKSSAEIEKERHAEAMGSRMRMQLNKDNSLLIEDKTFFTTDTISQDLTIDNRLNRLRKVKHDLQDKI